VDLVGAGDRHVREHVRVPPHQLGHDPVGDVIDRVAVGALGRDPRVEHHLQQHVTECLAEGPVVAGLERLVRLLQQVRSQRLSNY
jgi:hypothetical protein